MPWDPEKYNQFKNERQQPFFDLLSHIKDKPGMNVLDLGCGTGQLTKLLADKLTNPNVLGIDSSPHMLDKAREYEHLHFRLMTIEHQVHTAEKWDLIFANASLQWVDGHRELFPQFISKLNPGGQLAIQMPSQEENLLNKILLELVQEKPFSTALSNWKRISPVLSIDRYAQILFEKDAQDLTLYQKVYPLIANSHKTLFDFISGSALVPYMERLDIEYQEQLSQEFMKRITREFQTIPAIYAFKRLIIYAVF